MKPRSCIAAAFALALLGAGSVQAASNDWPEWVLNTPPGETAGSDCVPDSGNLPIDRNQATAKARLALAQQIDVKIEAMDETYESRVREGKAEKLVTSFRSSSKQTVSLSLQGAKLVRSESVKNRQGRFFCALVALPKEAAEKLPGDVIRSVGRGVDQETEALLLTKFRQVAAARAAPPGATTLN
jgi:hypothetical protein